MELIFIIIAGILAYLLLKLLYRPFFISKAVVEIEKKYNRLLAADEQDEASALENFKRWQSGNEALRSVRDENEILESVNKAKQEKAREEEVHEKFARLKELFIRNNRKLSQSVKVYQKYLDIKLKQRQDSPLLANLVLSGAASLEEMKASAGKIKAALEKCERKLDSLLA